MSNLTRSCSETRTAEELLSQVYDELRVLAARKLSQERPGQTLQATALVHEAWLRLSRAGQRGQAWHGRGHFFCAAAEAMRRILIDRARHRTSERHGGNWERVPLDSVEVAGSVPADQLLALHEALDELTDRDPQAAELVKLRFFLGLTQAQAAAVLGVSRSAADRAWVFARAWLYQQIRFQ
jgi:RNA polymerase sigma factor (TIGR02999 family)